MLDTIVDHFTVVTTYRTNNNNFMRRRGNQNLSNVIQTLCLSLKNINEHEHIVQRNISKFGEYFRELGKVTLFSFFHLFVSSLRILLVKRKTNILVS